MVYYDPYMPEIIEDPHAVYAQLRAEAPVYYLERFDAWVFARFEDIWNASQDNVHFSVRNSTAERPFLERELASIEVLSTMDPPRHTPLRKQLFPRFGPGAAKKLEPRVRSWVRECIERQRDAGRIDAVDELAQPIAVRVACAVGGFPVADADRLVEMVRATFARAVDHEGTTDAGVEARETMRSYLFDLVRERRRGPRQEDALGVLLDLRDEEGLEYAPERIAQHLTLLLVGATETFPKAFASGLLRLWQHPDQRRECARDPALIPGALQEILRYDMPTQWLGRTAIRPIEVGGKQIQAGQPVLFLYPSGNRDEREFDEPDRFDIHRAPERILTFGHGTHRCLGAFMAQMEGRVLLEETLKAFPEYEVLEDELYRPRTEFVQGYQRFPIAFRAPSKG
jgi:cytochrome P450